MPRDPKHLRLIDTPTDYQASDPGPVPEEPARARDAEQIIGQIVMHAAAAWVIACMERDVHTVEVSRSSAPATFDAVAKLVDGGEQWLRVHTRLESGPRLHLSIEPIHP